jgi:AcrR family transcriptional regulator
VSLSSHCVSLLGYDPRVPKLWTETIETHRQEVREAIVETAAALVAEHGLPSVTMSQIAEETGIGRATLYKYFPDVEAILVAWHERHVERHLAYLAQVRDSASNEPGVRLAAVLEAYALMSFDRSHGHQDSEHAAHVHREAHGGRPHVHAADVSALVHRQDHVAGPQRRLNAFMRALLTDGARSGDVRKDVAPEELTRYCLGALEAARDLPSRPAVRRLVEVTLAGLRPKR